MGRPNQCNSCCGDGGDPPLPPISDCSNVICIVLMDENRDNDNPSNPNDPLLIDKVIAFRRAYPDRLLFVLDVFRDKIATDTFIYLPPQFYSDYFSYQLKNEFQMGFVSGLKIALDRDNGDTAIANANDPWGLIKKIVDYYRLGGDPDGVGASYDAANQVSIFTDDSGSMNVDDVRATLDKLIADIEADGKEVAASTFNGNEDLICPFVTDGCCPTADASTMQLLCGLSNSCEPQSISFTSSTLNSIQLIREYCSIPLSNGYPDVCGICISSAEETDKQSFTFGASVYNSRGVELPYAEITYIVEYSDDGVNWFDTGAVNLTGFSGIIQNLSVLMDFYGGSSFSEETVHSWLGSTVDSFTTVDFNGDFGQICRRRVYDRLFRVKATHAGLTALLGTFKLYELRRPATEYTVSLLSPRAYGGLPRDTDSVTQGVSVAVVPLQGTLANTSFPGFSAFTCYPYGSDIQVPADYVIFIATACFIGTTATEECGSTGLSTTSGRLYIRGIELNNSENLVNSGPIADSIWKFIPDNDNIQFTRFKTCF
jgi:hypothetical protein